MRDDVGIAAGYEKSEPAPGQGPALMDLILGTGGGTRPGPIAKWVSYCVLPTRGTCVSSIAVHCPLLNSDCRFTKV